MGDLTCVRHATERHLLQGRLFEPPKCIGRRAQLAESRAPTVHGVAVRTVAMGRQGRQSGCVDAGRYCDASNPTIAGLSDAERARMPAFVLDHCRSQDIDPATLGRCLYCGVVFASRDEFHLGIFTGRRKIAFGYRKADVGPGSDETEWIKPDWLEKWVRDHPVGAPK